MTAYLITARQPFPCSRLHSAVADNLWTEAGLQNAGALLSANHPTDQSMNRPKSVLRLILLGFGAVTLPLMAAIVHLAFYVDRIAEQSTRALLHGVRATQSSQSLLEQLRATERNARQYQIVGTQSSFEVYVNARDRFQKTLEELMILYLDAAHRAKLRELAASETRLFELIRDHPPDPEREPDLKREFSLLADSTQAIRMASRELIFQEIAGLEEHARHAKRIAAWQAIGLVAAAALLAAVLTALIVKPIRQIKESIHKLGDGSMSTPISVTGPKDLADLGQRLEWLRSRLHRLEQQKARFLHSVSHELKTPLTAIREGTQLLEEQIVGPLNAEQREVAEIVLANGLRLQKLIEDLVNFTTAVTRRDALDIQLIDLDQVVHSVVANHKLGLLTREVELSLETENARVTGDPKKLSVVFENLLSNALNHCPAGGSVRVTLHRSRQTAVVNVKDSGPGFGAEDRARAFEAFYQGRRPSSGPLAGTGLGLSIAKEYVHMHRGQIEIVAGEVQGGHVRVTLPIAP